MNKIFILLLSCCLWTTVSTAQTTDGFAVDTLSDELFARMKGRSYPDGCTTARQDLRHLTVKHFDANGQEHLGEIVCNKRIANDLLDIFQKLHEARYPIERITLIDNYDADDEQSMRANNTSCFCFRKVSGTKNLSKHATGMAIDINPLYNPYIHTLRDGTRKVEPATATKYTDRQKVFPYKILRDDLCYRLFIEHGFTWGGNWRTMKDYQHFEK